MFEQSIAFILGQHPRASSLAAFRSRAGQLGPSAIRASRQGPASTFITGSSTMGFAWFAPSCANFALCASGGLQTEAWGSGISRFARKGRTLKTTRPKDVKKSSARNSDSGHAGRETGMVSKSFHHGRTLRNPLGQQRLAHIEGKTVASTASGQAGRRPCATKTSLLPSLAKVDQRMQKTGLLASEVNKDTAPWPACCTIEVCDAAANLALLLVFLQKKQRFTAVLLLCIPAGSTATESLKVKGIPNYL